MDPFITIIVVIVLVIGGVWGSLIISALLKRRSARLESSPNDPRIEELQEDHRLLEARFEQLEEEVGFLRELHKPESPAQLRSPDSGNA